MATPAAAKAKITDILMVGSGQYATILADEFSRRRLTVHMVETHEMHVFRCVAPKVYSVDGKRFSARKVVISVGPQCSIPNIEGLERVTYTNRALELIESKKRSGDVLVVASDHTDLEDAEELVKAGFNVTVVSGEIRPLPEFDSTVSDYAKRTLKLQKIKFLENTTALSVTQTNKGIYVICEQEGTPKRLRTDYLVVRPQPLEYLDFGFGNENLAPLSKGITHADVSHVRFGHVTYVNPKAYLNLDDLARIARSVTSRFPVRLRRHVDVHTAMLSGDDYVTVGPSESALIHIRSAYSKSLAVIKDPATGRQAGFVKLLALYTGKLVGVSIVYEGANELTPLFVEAIRAHKKARSVLSQLALGNPLAEAYLEALEQL